ncbi:hypothetical protein QC763_0101510 [Podospora pseudopauciseta]|uniref:Uncharacterized protein n=2 Tax=Podospora TaxID=5144 RepID=A0ABR0H6Q8_9PEZI|nr:hypothetical protein QC763_0101510 [Podospora pseudopauciseta]KAK4672032.1 hypothetical protein QC764_0101390 [Podospora pseudoanserina]
MRPKMAPATTNRLALPIWTPGQPGRRRTKLRLPRSVSERGRVTFSQIKNVKLSIHLGVKVVVGSSGALHCVLLNKRA